MDGPPIHDALCVSWLANPEFFKGKWATLEVGAVTEGPEGRGETRPVKGTEWQDLSFEDGRKDGKGGNCFSLMELDVSGHARVADRLSLQKTDSSFYADRWVLELLPRLRRQCREEDRRSATLDCQPAKNHGQKGLILEASVLPDTS